MEQEDLSLLVQRELLQVQRMVVFKDIQDMNNGDRDPDHSPANSPKPKVKVPDHRDVVAKWMNEAVLFGLGLTNSNDHSKSSQGPRLFTLAASMMDLFLMKCKIKLTQLQLLGSACLSLAAKTRRIQLEEASLIECSDYTITKEEIQAWEKLVLTKLDWNVNLVIPQDYLDLFCINMNILPTFNDANKRSATPNEGTGWTSKDNETRAMTTTKHNKYTANERTKELGNKTLTPTGDNQHPEATDEKECSSSSVLSPCSTLHPLIVKLKSPTKIAEKLQNVEEEDNIAHKKQIAQDEQDSNNSGLDLIRTQILHDADLMSSLCSCSYALTNYYPPRIVAMACLLLSARHHCCHLHGYNRSKISEVSQSISTETVCKLLNSLFHFHEDDSSPSIWHAAANLLQSLQLNPCHYSTCHTDEINKKENNLDNNHTDDLVIISNAMGEIEQILCTNLPSPTQLPSISIPSSTITTSPPINSSLSITASILDLKKSSVITSEQQKSLSENPKVVNLSPPMYRSESDEKTNLTPPMPTSDISSSIIPTSSSCLYSDVLTTSTPKARQPLSCKDNVDREEHATISTSRRRLHINSDSENDKDDGHCRLQNKENDDSAIGMNLDVTGASSKGSQYCGSNSHTNSSPSSNGSSKTSSPDSGTSTISHTKMPVSEIESLKNDMDLKEMRDALADCTTAASSIV